jgi:hypothetical protein
MEAQELLEHEPNAPSDTEQLDDVNNIAAMAPVTIPEDPVVIPEAMRIFRAIYTGNPAIHTHRDSNYSGIPSIRFCGRQGHIGAHML